MTFTFKLSKRLAQSWTTRAVLVVATFLHLPFETTVTLVILSSFLSVRVWRSEIGDRRRCRDGRRYPSGQSARLTADTSPSTRNSALSKTSGI